MASLNFQNDFQMNRIRKLAQKNDIHTQERRKNNEIKQNCRITSMEYEIIAKKKRAHCQPM